LADIYRTERKTNKATDLNGVCDSIELCRVGLADHASLLP
jgi:hypothetical protein